MPILTGYGVQTQYWYTYEENKACKVPALHGQKAQDCLVQPVRGNGSPPRTSLSQSKRGFRSGKVADIRLERAMHVTFNVSKSWKGIDTELTTVHIDNPARPLAEFGIGKYLVYAYRDFFEVRMPTCSGSSWTENQGIIRDDIVYLDAHYEPIKIAEGHTGNVNLLPIMQIVGSLCGIAAVAYVILAQRR
jgi:hypothetical protein